MTQRRGSKQDPYQQTDDGRMLVPGFRLQEAIKR